MRALLVHTRSHKIEKAYKTAGTAKAAQTRSKWPNGKVKYPEAEYSIMTSEEYDAQDTEVTVRNLMNGAPVKIRRSEEGTACDPSTERYWSM